MKPRPRVFLGLMDFVGYLSAISNGLSEIGINSFVLDTGNNRWEHFSGGHRNTITDWLLYSWRRFNATRNLSRVNPIRYFWTSMLLASTVSTIAWIAARFDIVYLKAGQGFFNSGWDVKFFKSIGIVTIAHFAGSDSRPPYLNGFHGKVMSGEELVEWSRKIKNAVNHAQLFDYVIDNPLAGHFHSRRCIIGQCLGTIADVHWVETCARTAKMAPLHSRQVRVVHTPSRAAVKGSDLIRRAVGILKEKGLNIDYVEVENQSNVIALSIMSTADIVVDELYSDSIGATVSSEAAILSKPSINGSYGIDELRRFLPRDTVLPTFLIEPEQIQDALEILICDSTRREELGQSARKFVLARNTQKAVAERLLQIAVGAAPEAWYFDPNDIEYVYGVAGSKEEVRQAVASILKAGGASALQLDDKPRLRDAIVKFSQQDADQLAAAAIN